MKLRLTLATTLGALMFSNSAFALSCAQPDMSKTLETAKASEDVYHILVGKFVSESVPVHTQSTLVDNGDGTSTINRPPLRQAPITTRSWFEGSSISPNRHSDVALTRFPVDIETSCIGGRWCTSVPSANRDMIAFIQARDGQPPVLKIKPCSALVFSSNIAEHVETIRQGLR